MEDLLSSPDPLNDSFNYPSPQKTRRSSRVRRSLPPRSSSPTKQTFELNVGDSLSPQKLLVTVEADNGQYPYTENDPFSSPSRGLGNVRKGRTTTTTIPLKGLSDSEEEEQAALTPKRGRGRPRKSIGSSAAPKKSRASTPVRKSSSRRKSIGDLVDGDDVDDVSFQIGKSVEVNRGKGRSRSRSTKTGSRKPSPGAENIISKPVTETTEAKKGRPRRKKSDLNPIVVLEDQDIANSCGEGDIAGLSRDFSALQPIDTNGPSSAYSTIRSATTAWGEPDVVARFDPGNKTPRQSGWSSPQVVHQDVGHPNKLPSISQSKSSRSRAGLYEDRTLSPVNVAQIGLRPEFEDDQDHVDSGNDDEMAGLLESDTILESEGFSMISVDSVPSLRDQLSSPISKSEKAPTPSLKHKAVQTLRGVTGHDDSFSSIPEEVLEAATPGRRAHHQQMLSVPRHANDSFSSVPPEILEAATPARKPVIIGSRSNQINRDMYEDSFSAIPYEILDAATPAAKRISPPLVPQPQSDNVGVNQSTRNISPYQSESTRLLTPGETPSPGDDVSAESHQLDKGSQQNGINKSTNDSSLLCSQMPSSPPSVAPRRYTYTAHLRRRSQLHPDITQTPSIVFSSPALPPPINGPRGQPLLATSNLMQRPALSPIARAGQALQNIIVPSSPRNRSLSLGSPFKSPATERHSSSSAVREFYLSPSQERGIRNLPKLDLHSNLSGNSFASQDAVKSAHHDDPFRPDDSRRSQRSPLPEDKQSYKLGLPVQKGSLSCQSPTIAPTDDLNQSDNDMSWQVEDEVPVPKHDDRIKQTQEQVWAAERAAVSQQISLAPTKDAVVIGSDDGSASIVDHNEEEEEEFGLLMDAINSSSPVVPQYQDEPSRLAEKPRRSKLPSPWRKNSKRLVYSDELSRLSSPPSNAALQKLFGNVNATQPTTARRVETPENHLDDGEDVDLSGWQIPQKSNFNPQPRARGKLDLSALLASSPANPLPVLPRNSHPTSHVLFNSTTARKGESHKILFEEKSVTSKSIDRDVYAPIPQKAGFNPRSRDTSPVKDPTSFNLFGPPKAPRSSFSEDVSSSTGQICEPLSPNRQNYNQKKPSQHYTASCSDTSDVSTFESADKENLKSKTRTQTWAESIDLSPNIPTPGPTLIPASPTKSCLRSPVKATSSRFQPGNTTPGKNVQFASSSPMPSPSEEILSATTWSKKHWLLLDGIWRSHMALRNCTPASMLSGQLSTPKEGVEDPSARKRRNSTRVISKLLGRGVSTPAGWRMTLEQWHLEVVDEFRGKCPGWEEKVIATRVFSLVVGAEMRVRAGGKI